MKKADILSKTFTKISLREFINICLIDVSVDFYF